MPFLCLSGDPAETVDEEEYLQEVEREDRKFFCHEHFDVTHHLDAVDFKSYPSDFPGGL